MMLDITSKEDFDGVLNEFDKVIGLDRLKVIHVNDSKNPQGSHKDRHANIGFGTSGFEALNKIVHHEQLKQLPKILETPYIWRRQKNKKLLMVLKSPCCSNKRLIRLC